MEKVELDPKEIKQTMRGARLDNVCCPLVARISALQEISVVTRVSTILWSSAGSWNKDSFISYQQIFIHDKNIDNGDAIGTN